MGLFNRGTTVEDDTISDGLVRAFIRIKRIDRSTRSVKATLSECSTGKTVYKSEYQTHTKTDFYAYENASDDLKQYIKREDYVLYGDIGTNVELPGIVTVDKRMR